MLLHPALHLLASASTIVARAVSTDASLIPDTNTTGFVASAPTNATIGDAACKDIDHCRTLGSLIQSCIVTILACVWFAVHRNVPAPTVRPPFHSNLLVRVFLFVWYKIRAQRQAVTVFVVTLLVPEWVLAWALRQFIAARDLSKKLEEARRRRQETRLREGRTAEKEASEFSDNGLEDDSLSGPSAMSMDSEHDQLIKRQVTSKSGFISKRCKGRCEECGLHPSADDLREAEYDQVRVARRVGKANEVWDMPHAFFVIMGGYQFHNKDESLHPLSPKNAQELVGRGHLVPSTPEELANQSKGDALSKGVAILQTLWFVMQCIARRIEHLPLTSLEVMTLAYTVITVAMYIVWWDKPLSVSCAVRVPEEKVEEEEPSEYATFGEQVMAYVIGNQDTYVDLRKCHRVPTFWAGVPGEEVLYADMIALVVAMAFGAVHCIAWSNTFQSHFERQLWRASAITIIVTPAALVLVVALAYMLNEGLSVPDHVAVIIPL
ncbi:hypothetical protein HWV62_12410 [Athelia sp. TMB]|nr:hypothetical protein HWV62_12410 [Athelia sp. TMB]